MENLFWWNSPGEKSWNTSSIVLRDVIDNLKSDKPTEDDKTTVEIRYI